MKNSFQKLMMAGIALAVVGLTSCHKKFDPASYAPPLNIGGFTSSGEIGAANLVAHFAFDGNLVDSVSGTAGTNTNTSFGAGFKGQALQGADQGYVLFDPPASITGMNSFTIAYWVKSPLNTSGIVGLVNLSHTSNFWGNIDMFFENGSTQDAAKFRAHITNGGTEAWIAKDGMPGIFDNWTHFALAYDAGSSTFTFYVNGSVSHTQTVAGFGPINFTNTGPMVFGTVHFQTTPSLTSGSGSQGWASFLTGMLDEVRIYNRALNSNEVNSLVKLEGRGK